MTQSSCPSVGGRGSQSCCQLELDNAFAGRCAVHSRVVGDVFPFLNTWLHVSELHLPNEYKEIICPSATMATFHPDKATKSWKY